MDEPRYGPTGAGTVLLELGADVGALILHAPAELNGREVEISRAGEPAAPRAHAQVRERPTGRGAGYSALYPGLAAGTYAVWRDEAAVAATVTVTGGQIASCSWPAGDQVVGQPADR
ncbi:MAG: hypothetical protein ABSB01_10630 [Streptosporangiaceae bacterium]